MIKCFTKITGAELKEYGIKEIFKPSKIVVDDLDMYEIEAWMIDGRIAYIVPSSHPTNERPLHMAGIHPDGVRDTNKKGCNNGEKDTNTCYQHR